MVVRNTKKSIKAKEDMYETKYRKPYIIIEKHTGTIKRVRRLSIIPEKDQNVDHQML